MANQARKPKGSPNGTGGQFDHTPNQPNGILPALTDPEDMPVGGETMDKAETIALNLYDRQQDWDDLPVGGCYRIDDLGNYVTEADWDTVWAGHELEKQAWMLSDNGQYSRDQVAAMTPAEIKNTYASEDFRPDIAYYTEKDEGDYDMLTPMGDKREEALWETSEYLANISKESMDFKPGEQVHATATGFVGEQKWNEAFAGSQDYEKAAYELSQRHPGLRMAELTPQQVFAMHDSEKAYEDYVYTSNGAHSAEADLERHPSMRRAKAMYRQNERNTRYVGRDLNNVICMREDEYKGNDGTLTANVQDATLRILDTPEPTTDMDSMSTIALGLNHDPENTTRMIIGQMSGHSDARDLKQSLQEQLASGVDSYGRANAEKLSTILTCIENNADDTHGAAWLATSLRAFADYRQGDTDIAQHAADQIRSARIGNMGRPAALAVTIADIIHNHLN